MAGRPGTFADLIRRIVEEPSPDQLQHRPLFGRAREFDGRGEARAADWWIILHGTSSSGVMLIHQQSVASGPLEVRIDTPSGAVLSVIVDVKSTHPMGELFETTAEFIGLTAPPQTGGDATSAGN